MRKNVDTSKRILIEAEDWDTLPDLCDGGASVATAIAAGVSALANVGSGVAMVSKKRGTTRMMQVSKELANYNNMLARQNWNLENAYNSPAAQMQRYREAGLNPNLIYGQQNTAGNISTPQASLSDASSVLQSGDRYSKALDKLAGAASVYQDILQRSANIDNTKAVTQANLTEAALREAQTKGQDIQNQYQNDMMKYSLEGLQQRNAMNAIDLENKRMFDASQRRLSLLKTREEIANMSMDTTKKSKEIGKIDAEIGSIDQNIKESKARVWSLEKGVEVSFGQLAVAQQNANTNWYNAETNRQNADTNSYNAWTNRFGVTGNLSFQREKFMQEFSHRKLMDYAEFGLKQQQFDWNRQMQYQSAMPQLSPFPFLKTK